MRRAAPFDDGCVHFSFNHLTQDVLFQRVHEARLSQARLADQQHDLTHAFLRLFPSVLEQADLVVAARSAARVQLVCRRSIELSGQPHFRSTRKSWTGCATPLIFRGPRLAHWNRPCNSRWVASVQMTWSGAAASSSRTATFRASPTSETASSFTSTIAGPVWRPTHGDSSTLCAVRSCSARACHFVEKPEARLVPRGARRPRRPPGNRSTPAVPARCIARPCRRSVEPPVRTPAGRLARRWT